MLNEVYQFQDIPSSKRLSPNEVYLPNKEQFSSGEAAVRLFSILSIKILWGREEMKSPRKKCLFKHPAKQKKYSFEGKRQHAICIVIISK